MVDLRCRKNVEIALQKCYAAPDGGARRSFGHVLDHQHRRIVAVALDNLDDPESAAAERDRVAGTPERCPRSSVSAGRPVYRPPVAARRSMQMPSGLLSDWGPDGQARITRGRP
jgi:hypothetical protein